MVIQRITVTAKNEEELAMRISDNEIRDYKVIQKMKPQYKEHKHFTYKPSIGGTRKTFAAFDSSEKHGVIMERDYIPKSR